MPALLKAIGVKHREKTIQPHRGILRLYMLHKLSREPQSGYGLMRSLSESTDGSWRPGPGSIYPILKELEREGLIRDHTRIGRARQVYRLTEKGKLELASARERFDEYSKQGWRKIRGLMLEIASPRSLSERIIEGPKFQEMIWEKVLSSPEVPDREKIYLLKEYRLFVEKQLDWVDSKLKELE